MGNLNIPVNWNYHNWGTKIVGIAVKEENDKKLIYEFVTAWCPDFG